MMRITAATALLALLTSAIAAEPPRPEATEVWEPVPAVVTPGEGAAPPSDAVVLFHAPRFGTDGALTKPATITVFHNGVLVQDHFEIEGATTNVGDPACSVHGALPLMLQDHHNPVSYRNIWLRELNSDR
jgi:3-keto-disaccharide hydrolase